MPLKKHVYGWNCLLYICLWIKMVKCYVTSTLGIYNEKWIFFGVSLTK
jgi:hypothetical protein